MNQDASTVDYIQAQEGSHHGRWIERSDHAY
jgi:hypothetical protein